MDPTAEISAAASATPMEPADASVSVAGLLTAAEAALSRRGTVPFLDLLDRLPTALSWDLACLRPHPRGEDQEEEE